MITDSMILARFCKCGDLNHLSRRFHNLDRAGKVAVLDAIREGIDPAKAVRKGARIARAATRQAALAF